jgi:hypothetical protein
MPQPRSDHGMGSKPFLRLSAISAFETRRSFGPRQWGSQIQPFHLNQISGSSAVITINARLH